jgi:hypothetical protein
MNYLNKASPIGIKDLHCKGANPLRCVICQEKPKRENKSTCGDENCMHEFFAQRVIPDLDETKTVKTNPIISNTKKMNTKHTLVLDSEMTEMLQLFVGKIIMQTGKNIGLSNTVRFCIQHASDTDFSIEEIEVFQKQSSHGGNY